MEATQISPKPMYCQSKAFVLIVYCFFGDADGLLLILLKPTFRQPNIIVDKINKVKMKRYILWATLFVLSLYPDRCLPYTHSKWKSRNQNKPI